jgi:hypothetical protein
LNSPVRYRQLTWADYKGTPTNDHLASTCSGIVIEKDTAYAIFEPNRSWTRTNDAATLRHEQLHFAITEKWAAEICMWIKTNNKVTQCYCMPDFSFELNSWEKEEARYDAETNHGQDTEAQKQWEEKIKL